MRILVTLFLIFCSTSIYWSQASDGSLGHTIQTAACLVENNGITLSNENVIASPPLEFSCGRTHNNLFYAFCPNDSTIELSVEATNCIQGEGIQVIIYNIESYASLEEVFCFSEEFQLSLNISIQLEQDQIYILMIDGNVGDVCDFRVDVSGIREDAAEINTPSLSEDSSIQMCLGDSKELFILDTNDQCLIYQWLENEDPQIELTGSNDPREVTVKAIAVGNTEICAEITNFCDRKKSCVKIQVIAPPLLEITDADPVCFLTEEVNLSDYVIEISENYSTEELNILWFSEFPESNDLQSNSTSALIKRPGIYYGTALAKEDTAGLCPSNVVKIEMEEISILLDHKMEEINCGKQAKITFLSESNIPFEGKVSFVVQNNEKKYNAHVAGGEEAEVIVDLSEVEDSMCIEIVSLVVSSPKMINSCVRILDVSSCMILEERKTVNYYVESAVCSGEKIEIEFLNDGILPYEVEINDGIVSLNTEISSARSKVSFVAINPEQTKVVLVKDQNSCPLDHQGIIDVELIEACIYVPNSFSPDNDGVNDEMSIHFRKPTLYSSINSLKVFNRWGQLLYEQNNLPVLNSTRLWDGMVNGIPLDPQVLLWTIELEYLNSSKKLYYGDISILYQVF